MLIEELKKYGNINQAIKEKYKDLDQLQIQTNHLTE